MANAYQVSISKVLITKQQARGLSDIASSGGEFDLVPA